MHEAANLPRVTALEGLGQEAPPRPRKPEGHQVAQQNDPRDGVGILTLLGCAKPAREDEVARKGRACAREPAGEEQGAPADEARSRCS